jgi:hypothetical protein
MLSLFLMKEKWNCGESYITSNFLVHTLHLLDIILGRFNQGG